MVSDRSVRAPRSLTPLLPCTPSLKSTAHKAFLQGHSAVTDPVSSGYPQVPTTEASELGPGTFEGEGARACSETAGAHEFLLPAKMDGHGTAAGGATAADATPPGSPTVEHPSPLSPPGSAQVPGHLGSGREPRCLVRSRLQALWEAEVRRGRVVNFPGGWRNRNQNLFREPGARLLDPGLHWYRTQASTGSWVIRSGTHPLWGSVFLRLRGLLWGRQIPHLLGAPGVGGVYPVSDGAVTPTCDGSGRPQASSTMGLLGQPLPFEAPESRRSRPTAPAARSPGSPPQPTSRLRARLPAGPPLGAIGRRRWSGAGRSAPPAAALGPGTPAIGCGLRQSWVEGCPAPRGRPRLTPPRPPPAPPPPGAGSPQPGSAESGRPPGLSAPSEVPSRANSCRRFGATWDSGPAAGESVCYRDSATRVSGRAQGRRLFSALFCQPGDWTPWWLWEGHGWAGFTPCWHPHSRTSCFKASQLGPGRGSGFARTWRGVIAIIRWGLGTRPLALCGGNTRARGGLRVPRWLEDGEITLCLCAIRSQIQRSTSTSTCKVCRKDPVRTNGELLSVPVSGGLGNSR
ncbi:hypothetical protein Cadr_000004575 [Camelus dromedarius]|uniref:Uncharacterized protein n=1 Tax=Camelus dromedarius TaxID=9838 RepID=A0A5N4ED74_CAMDR|nr:hypothetical protein Cadr_000004575 [Camelus dromedarius]